MNDFLTIVLAILGLSTVVIIHELGHFLLAIMFKMPIKAFSIGFGAGLSWAKNGITYRLGSVPLGGYVSFLSPEEMKERGYPEGSRSFGEFPLRQRIAVYAAGPLINIISGVLLLFVLMPSEVTALKPVISTVKPDTLAQSAGINPGDRIVSVAGHPIETRDEVLKHIQLNLLDEQIAVVIEQASTGSRHTLLAPSELWRSGEGMGVVFVTSKDAATNPDLVVHRNYSLFEKAFQTVDIATTVIVSIAETLIHIPTDSYARDQLGSVIMLGAEGTKAAKRDWHQYLVFLASINLMIAFVNLLPLPYTDGSQILLGTIQGIIKRPIPKPIESAYFYLGAAAFASIFVLGITNDIARYFL